MCAAKFDLCVVSVEQAEGVGTYDDGLSLRGKGATMTFTDLEYLLWPLDSLGYL